MLTNGKVATPNGTNVHSPGAQEPPMAGTAVGGALTDSDIADCPTPQRSRPHSPNVKWQRSALGRRERWLALGHAGATIWFTGLPAAGKSTIAGAVEEHLVGAGRPAFLLDGDNLRHGLNGDLGFGEQARTENVRRTAHVARLLAESGTIALVSLVSPYARDREEAAALHSAVDLPFIEVFVDAPLALCEQRDPKGLYARARAGDLAGLTGIDAPYEAPLNPDLVLRSGVESVEAAVERVSLALLTACAAHLAV
ncbi:MAG: adenylyl-sulfate kinase [Solirubrobacteraceae bacterium]